MKLFAGISTTDYQDLLRAVGLLLDERRLRDIRLWEHEDGLIVQGRPRDEGDSGSFQTYMLTDEDLNTLLQDAYKRRSKPRPELRRVI